MSYKKKQLFVQEVNEPMAAYLPIGSPVPFYQLLNGVKATSVATDFDILKLSRQGLPKKTLLSLAQKISFTLQELAGVMHISDRTLQRYEDAAIIKTEYAEKAIELARLYSRGQEVFGSMDKFKQWMRTPAHIYKGETPASLLDTSIGFDMIFKELGRIEHGIFA